MGRFRYRPLPLRYRVRDSALCLQPCQDRSLASVGVTYSGADPYESEHKTPSAPPFTGEYIYQDFLPISLSDWSWGARVDWQSSEQVYEGTHSFKATLLQDWAGARIAASSISIASYKGISLSYIPMGIGDIYLELFDQNGNSLGQQSLGWYAPGGKLTPNQWNVVTVPLPT